jgi:hypothetical protein
MSGGLEKYMELAEGDNGGIMMSKLLPIITSTNVHDITIVLTTIACKAFVTRTLAKMENIDEQFLVI